MLINPEMIIIIIYFATHNDSTYFLVLHFLPMNRMLKLNFRTKALLTASFLCFLMVGTVMYVVIKMEKSADEIVDKSKLTTENAALQLKNVGFQVIDSLISCAFFEEQTTTRYEMKHIDSLLAKISSNCLISFEGMEGGYYFPQIDEFLGYSFPTSPTPKPAFGPPPRSYVIIKDQCLKSIQTNTDITLLHQFDPATFPLVTVPIAINGKVVGCVWARVHIERLIPTFSLIDVLLYATTIFLIGFAIALIISWNMRKRMEEIRIGLHMLHTDGNFRFKEKRGVFGEITHSINEMIEVRAQEQERREKLENDLYQQDKMVTLGTLIAGVAHEVKTPLAIIKTRIQMWDRKLRQLGDQQSENDNVVTPEAMELVIGEIDRLTDLVKRLLIFSKPVNNKLRSTNLSHLLTHTLNVLQAGTEEKNISTKQEFSDNLPLINIDPQSIEQVLLNVLTNSLEAMEPGGTLTVRAFQETDNKSVIIEIEDTGTGIPPDTLHKIFNPFFTTKEGGVGLGLSISYEIVRAHKGKIEFPKSDHQGTICKIMLPIH